MEKILPAASLLLMAHNAARQSANSGARESAPAGRAAGYGRDARAAQRAESRAAGHALLRPAHICASYSGGQNHCQHAYHQCFSHISTPARSERANISIKKDKLIYGCLWHFAIRAYLPTRGTIISCQITDKTERFSSCGCAAYQASSSFTTSFLVVFLKAFIQSSSNFESL